MDQYSYTEENYLKAIYFLSQGNKGVSTNAIAQSLNTKPGSVSDMLKRLSDKNLLIHKKYQGAKLTELGKGIAIRTIRKHRLWESFLVEKLQFGWDEVHEVAEQLEHIQSAKLTDSLDAFLGFPKYDPHGDPIPDKNGVFPARDSKTLDQVKSQLTVIVKGVKDTSPEFLQYIEKLGIQLGDKMKVTEIEPFDKSVKLYREDDTTYTLSALACSNIYVKTL